MRAPPRPPPLPRQPRSWSRSWSRSWPLWLLAGLTALPELVLLGADAGLWGTAAWRPRAYQWGAFWAGLWRGWTPNYPAQPWVMMATYPFLHTGPGHLAGNLAALGVLGGALGGVFRPCGVLALWAGGALAGGLAFGVLATSTAPMVGASGAVFALAGAWWRLDRAARPRGWRREGRALALAAAAVLGNAAMFALSPAGIAWETHLGGALAGAALAGAIARNANGRPKAPAA